ncbi:hypothetical protein NDU88_001945 [Pleurodeles waltl]|uniref:Uncharacterized protein n=1 Tax=Pleurodeles waltl TaxID=8319 RepID=A0AAV7RE21_PLEWA|nr:hypothetical protein NDU88_001945 [Pleurodeles waltl]
MASSGREPRKYLGDAKRLAEPPTWGKRSPPASEGRRGPGDQARTRGACSIGPLGPGPRLPLTGEERISDGCVVRPGGCGCCGRTGAANRGAWRVQVKEIESGGATGPEGRARSAPGGVGLRSPERPFLGPGQVEVPCYEVGVAERLPRAASVLSVGGPCPAQRRGPPVGGVISPRWRCPRRGMIRVARLGRVFSQVACSEGARTRSAGKGLKFCFCCPG